MYDSQEIDKVSGMLHGHSGAALVREYMIKASEPSNSKAVPSLTKRGQFPCNILFSLSAP